MIAPPSKMIGEAIGEAIGDARKTFFAARKTFS
jgi:hypothetical protein